MTLKVGTPSKGLFPDLALYKTSVKISIPEVVGYKTSLFNIFTPKWLPIIPYGDFVSGLTSPPVETTGFLDPNIFYEKDAFYVSIYSRLLGMWSVYSSDNSVYFYFHV